MLHKVAKEIELLNGDPKDQLEVNKFFYARQAIENLIISIIEDNEGVIKEHPVVKTSFV